MNVVTVRERHAILAGLRLALGPPGRQVSAREVADFGGIPVKVAEQTLQVLRRGGVAVSKRGRAGGYCLARGAALISVAEVVDTVDGSHGGMGRMPNAGPDSQPMIAPIIERAEEAARAVLAATTLADLAGHASRTAMYYI